MWSLVRSASRLCARPAPLLARGGARRFTEDHPSMDLSAHELTDLLNPTPVHHDLRDMIRSFTKDFIEPQATEYNNKEELNLQLFRQLGALNLLGLTIPEAFGGCGLDATAACILLEEISYSDPGFGLSVLAHSILFCNNLALNGTPAQKKEYLPDACNGKIVCGLGMTESNLLNMQTRAEKRKGIYYLNGEKTFISNATVDKRTPGDAYLVYAYTDEPRVLSLFLVDKSCPGFTLGRAQVGKLGCRASPTGELLFNNVPLAENKLVGQEGHAMLCMMRNLELERLTLAAQSVVSTRAVPSRLQGLARRCLNEMITYAKSRKAFGRPISEFGQIQRHIARSYANFTAGRTYLYHTAHRLSLESFHNRLDTDGVKLFCSGMAKEVADSAIQVLGGTGYFGESVVERLWRDSKLFEIGGGTNEAHEKNMTKDLLYASSSTLVE